MFNEEIIEILKARLLFYEQDRLHTFLTYLRWYKHKNNPKELVEVFYSSPTSCIVNVEKMKSGIFSTENIINVHKDTLSEIDFTEKAFITLIKKSQIK